MEIELARQTIRTIRSRQKNKRLFRGATVWGTALLLGLFLAISAAGMLFDRRNAALTGRIQTLKRQIEAKAKTENQQVYVSSKINSFAGLVKTHEVHQAVTETIFSLIPDGTSLKGFEVKESGVISLSGSTPDWPTLFRLLDNLKQPSQPLTVSRYQVKKISFGGDGAISFDLEINLGL